MVLVVVVVVIVWMLDGQDGGGKQQQLTRVIRDAPIYKFCSFFFNFCSKSL